MLHRRSIAVSLAATLFAFLLVGLRSLGSWATPLLEPYVVGPEGFGGCGGFVVGASDGRFKRCGGGLPFGDEEGDVDVLYSGGAADVFLLADGSHLFFGPAPRLR